jgi:SAM-dependent methyltransferase
MTDHDEVERVREIYDRRGVSPVDVDLPEVKEMVAERLAAWRRRIGPTPPSIVVEVGAGTGLALRGLVDHAGLPPVAIDLVVARAAAARDRGAAAVCADGRAVPLRSGSVDVVVCSTLFSSIIDPAVATAVADEVDRVLAPTGLILWFDLRIDNPRNPEVRGLPVAAVEALFPGFELDLERAVLLPPLARRLGRHVRMARALARVPILRGHLVGSLSRRASGRPVTNPRP